MKPDAFAAVMQEEKLSGTDKNERILSGTVFTI
jgi:hypothetical protein